MFSEQTRALWRGRFGITLATIAFALIAANVLADVAANSTDISADETALRNQVSDIANAWLAESAQASADSTATLRAETYTSLPSATVLNKTELINGAACVYLELPASFLANLTDLQCEAIISEQVSRMRHLRDLTGFGVFARPAGDETGEFKPLPAYLPKPIRVAEKPEPAVEAGLRGQGGMPSYNPGQPAGALSGKSIFLSPGHGWVWDSDLGRWRTQRGNTWGIVEDHSNGEAVFNHLARYLHNAGANVWPCRERDLNTEMVIVDNSHGSPGYTTTGTWTTSSATGSPYGSNYQYAAVSTTETAVATFTPTIPSDNYYAVYIWNPSGSSRPTAATVRVNHTGGTTTHVINMQQDGNTWRFLGMYYFEAGRDSAKGAVEVSNVGSDTSKSVIADAVRFGGGMGDYNDGGGVSGHARWEESGKYFAVFMGQTSSPNGTVAAMPLYADWESESWEDSMYVSWHSNATGSSYVGHGTDVYVYGPNGPPSPFGEFSGIAGSDTLAVRIRDEIVNDLRIGWNDPAWPGDLFTAWFGELNPSYNNEMPSVLIETAYHDSEVDALSILDPRFRDMMSRAIYQAIVKWWHYDADGPYTTATATATLIPEPPTNLVVRNAAGGNVRVSWHAPEDNSSAGDDFLGDPATGYLVQTSKNGFGFDDGITTTNTYMDFAGLPVGSVKYFRVIATNAGGQSFPSQTGGVMVTDGTTPEVLVVNGFDRMNYGSMRVEDDPYDADPYLRERPMLINHFSYIRTFAESLVSAGIPFDYCSNESVIDADLDMLDYPVVLWEMGEESEESRTLDSAEQTKVWQFLTGSGTRNLFVSGSDIGWDLDAQNHGRSAYNVLLKADYVANDAETYDVTAVAGSIFDGLSPFSFDNGSTIYDVDSPDVITVFSGSTAALSYDGGVGGTAGIIYDGAFRIVNFGFPFEAITDEYARHSVLYRILGFFGLDANPPQEPISSTVIVESRDASGNVTSAPAYVEDGDWASSSAKSSVASLTGSGSRYVTYDLPNTGTDNATFTPSIPKNGKYELYVTWDEGANCYDAKYTIKHHHGQTDLLIDQIPAGAAEPANTNQWVSLGSYWFAEGQNESSASVNVSEETVTGRPSTIWNQRVYADAAKWEYIEEWPDGDFDNSGSVDLLDYAYMSYCLTGPTSSYSYQPCAVFDFDIDGDIDLDDFAGFQEAFTIEP